MKRSVQMTNRIRLVEVTLRRLMVLVTRRLGVLMIVVGKSQIFAQRKINNGDDQNEDGRWW